MYNKTKINKIFKVCIIIIQIYVKTIVIDLYLSERTFKIMPKWLF